MLASSLVSTLTRCKARAQRVLCPYLGVEARETGPLAEGLVILDLDQRNRVLLAQRSDQLGVSRLITRVRQHAQVSLTTIERCKENDTR
jgi:hypothetical protein